MLPKVMQHLFDTVGALLAYQNMTPYSAVNCDNVTS